MIMGLAFGLLMYKYNSLWICIIAHICANIPDFIYSKESFASNGLKICIITVFSLAVLAALVWMFKGNRVTKKVNYPRGIIK
jgi:membrane protease YdiL (CAAX protease family)